MLKKVFTKKNALKFLNGTKEIIHDLGISTLTYAYLIIAILMLLEHIEKSQYLNILKNNYYNLNINVRVAIICIGIAVLLLIISNFRHAFIAISRVLKIPYINFSDRLVYGSLIAIVIKQNLISNFIDSSQLKTNYLLKWLVYGLLLTILTIRLFIIKKKYYSTIGEASFLVSDIPSAEDLLNRKPFINNLRTIIEKLRVESSFVIGLYGKWGEGKSTTLNLMANEIKKNKDIIIVKFDPWYYNSKDAIIKNFFNNIFSEINKKYFHLDLSGLVTEYKELLLISLDKFKLKEFGKTFIPLLETDKTVNKIKDKIQKKLNRLDKRILVLIDDIDRMDKEEMLLVFKLVKLCSDFNNFIYILSFDKERVEKILRDEIKDDNNFLEKIIQVGIELPKVENGTLIEILTEYLNRVFNHYNINLDSNDLIRLQNSFPYVSQLFKDIRSVKRFINLLSIRIPLAFDVLNFYDFFIVTIIEYCFPEKSKEIYLNKNRFVYFTEDFETHLDSRKNEIRKEFYNDFFNIDTNKEILIRLLSSIFTSVKNYKQGYSNLISEYKTDYTKLKNKSIEDEHFFDAYFTFEETHFMVINKKIIKFLDSVNKINSDEKVPLSSFELFFIELIKYEDQLIFFENLKGFVEEVNKSKINILVKIIYSYAYLLSDKSGFMALSPYQRAEALIAEIIEKNNNTTEKNVMFNDLVSNCNDLELISGVIYFTKKAAESDQELGDIRDNMISKFAQRLENEYIKCEKDVFTENQKHNAFWCFTNYIDDKNDIEKYFYKLLDKNLENIIHLLDVFKSESTVSNSERSWVQIKFNMESLEKYFNKEIINEYVDKYILSDDKRVKETNIIELFKKYYNGYIDSDW